MTRSDDYAALIVGLVVLAYFGGTGYWLWVNL